MHVYICMNGPVCVYICMYPVHLHVCTNVHTCVYVYMCACVFPIYVLVWCVHVRTHVYICMYACCVCKVECLCVVYICTTYAYMYTCVYVCSSICVTVCVCKWSVCGMSVCVCVFVYGAYVFIVCMSVTCKVSHQGLGPFLLYHLLHKAGPVPSA